MVGKLKKTILKSKKSMALAAGAAVVAASIGAAIFMNYQGSRVSGFNVATVSKGHLAKRVTITGDVEARSRSELYPSPTSKIAEVLVKEGQSVKKGDVLARLDSTEYSTQLKKQTINLENAEKTLEYFSGSSSNMDAATSRTSVRQAEIALDNARSNYSAAAVNLENVSELGNNSVSQAEIALDSAESNYRAAVNNLGNVESANRNSVSQAETALKDAVRTCDLAKMNFDSVKTLYDSDPSTYFSQYQSALQAFNQAKSAVHVAEANLSSAKISADAAYDAAAKAVSDSDRAVQSARVALAGAINKSDMDYDMASKSVSDSENAVRSAEVALSYAESQSSYSAATSDNRISIQQDQIRLLKADIDYLNGKIEECNLKANVDGVVAKMDIAANEYPKTGDAIIIDGAKEYVVNVDAGQFDSINIRTGQKANIKIEGIEKEYKGTVSQVGMLAEKSLTSADKDSKVSVKVSITNPDKYIKVGYEADVEIMLDEKLDAVQVNYEAVQIEADTKREYIFVLDRSNKADKRYVRTGLETETTIEVLSGLEVGDKYVANPDKTLEEGVKVKEAD